jgi:uncharacterized protein Veg
MTETGYANEKTGVIVQTYSSLILIAAEKQKEAERETQHHKSVPQ